MDEKKNFTLWAYLYSSVVQNYGINEIKLGWHFEYQQF